MGYLIALSLTLLLESLFWLVWMVPGKGKPRLRDWLLVVLVNLLTNPAVNLLHSLLAGQSVWLHTLMPEVLAVALEGLLYARKDNAIPRPWLFALLANLVSFGLGLALNRLL